MLFDFWQRIWTTFGKHLTYFLGITSIACLFLRCALFFQWISDYLENVSDLLHAFLHLRIAVDSSKDQTMAAATMLPIKMQVSVAVLIERLSDGLHLQRHSLAAINRERSYLGPGKSSSMMCSRKPLLLCWVCGDEMRRRDVPPFQNRKRKAPAIINLTPHHGKVLASDPRGPFIACYCCLPRDLR